jgi:hypothetical protein
VRITSRRPTDCINVVGEAEIVVVENVFTSRLAGVPKLTASEGSAFTRVETVHADRIGAVGLFVAVECDAVDV